MKSANWSKRVLYFLIGFLCVGLVIRLTLNIEIIMQVGFTCCYVSPLLFVFLGRDWGEIYTYTFLSSLIVPFFTAFITLAVGTISYFYSGDLDIFLGRLPTIARVFLYTWLVIVVSFAGFLAVFALGRFIYQKISK